MATNEKKGFWYKAGLALGLIYPEDAHSEERAGEVIYGPVSAPSGTRSLSSTVVTPGDAMSLVGVYRAVSILSTAIKQLPIKVWRGGVEIDTPSLIKQPSLNGTNRNVIIEETVMSLALNGNAFWLLDKAGPSGAVLGFEVLNPFMVVIERDNDTDKVVSYKYGEKTYPAWRVKHLALLRVPGSPYGLGPIQAAQPSMLGARDVQDYGNYFFRDGEQPSGILSTDQTLSPDQMVMYQDAWEAGATNRGGKPRVIGNGLHYQNMYLSPRDVQFIESQQWSKTEIATLFGIPAIYMLADGGNSMTYTNSVAVDIAFVRYTLTQYLNEIEQALSDISPRGQEARFVIEGLLRADQKTRFEGYATADFMTVNEKRAIEGLPPIDGGDELAKPVQQALPEPNKGGSV